MFLTVKQLNRDMGVDERIARFFVDRPVPENNRFWKERLLYIGNGNGFISIPVFYDLLFRLGVPLEAILAESHIVFMERLMHFSMQEEYKEIGKPEQLTAIRNLLAGRVKNTDRYDALNRYLDQERLFPAEGFGTEAPALNRADVYLYVLCDLPLNTEQWDRALACWYALHPTYLMMDDVKDLQQDELDGEENIILAWGGVPRGLSRAFARLEEHIAVLAPVSPALADFFRGFEPLIHRYTTV